MKKFGTATITSTDARYLHRVQVHGFGLETDEPQILGGKNAAPAPFDYYLASLGACTAITLRMYADRKQWPSSPIHVTANMERTQQGAEVDTRIHLDIELPAELTEEQRARMMQIARSCPVHRTLENPIHLSSGLKA